MSLTFSEYSAPPHHEDHMWKFFISLAFLILGLTPLTTQAQMSRPFSDNIITTPGDTPNFGLNILTGSELPTDAVCQNAEQKDPKRKIFCIKIPGEPSYRKWWRDQYLDQLVSFGWESMGEVMDSPPYVTLLTGKRESGCRSTLMVFLIYDGDGREAQNKTGTPLRALNATYVVFMDNSPNCEE